VSKPCRQAGLALGAAVLLVGCGGGSSPARPSEVATVAPSPTPASTAAATARYTVVFEATWSAASHPTDFPGDPHLSPLVGGTHAAAVELWREGGIASNGIEAMAELGRTTPLVAEVETAIAERRAEHVLLGEGISRSPGRTSLELEIGRDYPLVTLVSMIAPSPDWFAGVHGLSLIEGGDWVTERVVELYPYDAGTDVGASYESADQDAQPRLPVRAITGFPFEAQGRVAPVGTLRFRRLN
jgi:hypothetical protein